MLSCQNIDRAGGACVSQGDQSHHYNRDPQEKVAVVYEVDGEEKGVEDGADDHREEVDLSCIITSHLPTKQQTEEYLNKQDKGEYMRKSKHLKGQLDPPVSNVTFFGPKEVSWTPP